MKLPPPNRIAVWLTALAALAGAVAVPVANLDTSSAVTIAAGLVAICGVVVTWLKGWQAHEARTADGPTGPIATSGPIATYTPTGSPKP